VVVGETSSEGFSSRTNTDIVILYLFITYVAPITTIQHILMYTVVQKRINFSFSNNFNKYNPVYYTVVRGTDNSHSLQSSLVLRYDVIRSDKAGYRLRFLHGNHL